MLMDLICGRKFALTCIVGSYGLQEVMSHLSWYDKIDLF